MRWPLEALAYTTDLVAIRWILLAQARVDERDEERDV